MPFLLLLEVSRLLDINLTGDSSAEEPNTRSTISFTVLPC